MKMVKSLLLVSAAGLVAVSGAQAADLPVKAKPVEYVKVCSLYGVGFYYVPGTDICLKIGAYFRAEYATGNHGASLTNLDQTGADGQRTRTSGPDYQARSRTFVFLDTRQQTAYGTLRAYMNVGHSSDYPVGNTNAGVTSAAGIYANRAFIQLAGFTWGLATSYYDFYSSPATSYTVPFSSDTGDGGWKVAAYTAQLGNGLSASLSFEEPRRQIVTNTTISSAAAPFQPVGALSLQDQVKVKFPDVVANLRIDQAWGSAQIMGALHNVGGGYYGTALGAAAANGTCTTASGFNTCNGAPDDKLGFAIGAGIKVNFPMIGPGDYFQAQVNYTEGAIRYAATTPSTAGNPGIFGEGTGQGTTMGYGIFTDGIFCGAGVGAGATATCPAGGSGISLTTAWSVQAAYEHFWTPSLRTSLVGAYLDVSYDSAANASICAGQAAQTGGVNTIGPPGGAAACIANSGSQDWSFWSVSSRTQWNITKEFYVGLEGYYGRLETASKGALVAYTGGGGVNAAQPTGVRTLDDQNVYVYRMRVHRDLVP